MNARQPALVDTPVTNLAKSLGAGQQSHSGTAVRVPWWEGAGGRAVLARHRPETPPPPDGHADERESVVMVELAGDVNVRS